MLPNRNPREESVQKAHAGSRDQLKPRGTGNQLTPHISHKDADIRYCLSGRAFGEKDFLTGQLRSQLKPSAVKNAYNPSTEEAKAPSVPMQPVQGRPGLMRLLG